MYRFLLATLAVFEWLTIPANPLRAAEPPRVDPAQIEFFEKQIRPIFVAHCIKCHGAEKQKGGLRLDTQAAMLSGGDSGPAMVVGKPDDSRLIHAVRYTGSIQMPPGKKLNDDQVAALAIWVKMGAPWPPSTETRPAEPGKGFQITAQDRAFWSFQPVKNPPLPAVNNRAWPKQPLDYFILAQLEAKGLKPMPPADHRTLIRRMYFDLIGLPPTPEEVDQFCKAAARDRQSAIAEAVDRLLASPHYGERWARHWLDVARYAEDQAHSFQPRLYPHGHRYRDWLIKALNDDMPYDRFIMEQIAGDLLDGPGREDRLPALGYFALGPVYYGRAVLDELDDRVDVLCRGFLGLTVSCARCHDHKYDPIPTRDYYSLAGIFASTQYKEYPVADPKTSEEFERGQAAIKARNDEITAFLRGESQRLSEALTTSIARYIVAAWTLSNQRKSNPSLTTSDFARRERLHDFALDRWVIYLFPKQDDDRPHLARWRELLSKQDSAKDLSWDPQPRDDVARFAADFQDKIVSISKKSSDAAPAEPDQALYREIVNGLFNIPRDQVEKLLPGDLQKQLASKRSDLDKLKKALPKVPVIHSLTEGAQPTVMKVHIRGNPATLGDDAPHRFLAILAPDQPAFTQGSGRLELARAIASKDNPLTARVMVNRIWMHHFGRGIVGTPSNFGKLGERPTHPELLDHLAHNFMNGEPASGGREPPESTAWSIKKLHRTIMLSAAYQMSSQFDPLQYQVDPDNKLLWRMNRRRLEVETWRDAMLAVSGNLDHTIGGPSFDLSNPDTRRRTLYAAISRHNLDGLLRLFDFPDPNLTSDKRTVTTVPLQQLFVLNSEFMIRQAKALAARIIDNQDDDATRIRRAIEMVYARPASEREVQLGLAYLAAANGTQGLTAWERYAQVLLSANEFLFVD